MELWTIVPAVWVSTWVMCVCRTYPLVRYMIEQTPGGELVVGYKYTHMVISIVCLFFITPFISAVVLNERQRKNWCVAYVAQVCKENK